MRARYQKGRADGTPRDAGRTTAILVSGIALVALLVLLWLRDHPAPIAAAAGRPNVVVISIDTLRADHLSAYGYARETSPHIDALAQRGVLFENAYAHSPKTAVSHMSILTGLTPEAHGVRQWTPLSARRLSEDIPTLASLLRDAGYYTAAITGGGHMRADLGFDDGMDFFEVVYDVDQTFERAREVLGQREGAAARGAPFFLLLHTYEVHAPYAPVAPYDQMFSSPDYDGGILSSRGELGRAAGGDSGRQHEIFWQSVDEGSPADLQQLQDLYDGSIRLTDEHIGSFLDWLAEAKLLDQTLVIVLSDHGEEFLDHGLFQHEQAFEELLHVPLVMAFPEPFAGAGRGVRESAVVRLVDVAPTVLDFLALAAPGHMEGVSLLPLLSGGTAPPEIIVSGWPARGLRTLRDGGWKLIQQNSPTARWSKLYQLPADPKERFDVALREPEVYQRMRERLGAMVSESRAYREARARGQAVQPDAEALRRLRALGYIE